MDLVKRPVSWHIRNAALAMGAFTYITFDVLHSGPLTEVDATIARWNRPDLSGVGRLGCIQPRSSWITWSDRALFAITIYLSGAKVQKLATN